MNNMMLRRILLPFEPISLARKHFSTIVNCPRSHEVLDFGTRPETLLRVKSDSCTISLSFSLPSLIYYDHKSFCGLKTFIRVYISLNSLWKKWKFSQTKTNALVGTKAWNGTRRTNERNVVPLPPHSSTNILPARTHFPTCIFVPKSNVALHTFV